MAKGTRAYRHLCFALAMGALSLMLATVPSAAEPCPSTHAVPAEMTAEERAVVCEAAAFAEGLLGQCGITPKSRYTVRLEPEVRNAYGSCIFGRFRARPDTASIVSAEAAKKLVQSIPDDESLSVYKSLPPDELHRSFVVHEVAHAIVHQNFKVPPCLAVHEYVAGVAQLSAFPERTRAIFLSRFAGRDSYTAEMFNDILLAMEPGLYAAAAYRHFHRPGNGCGFIRRLLSDASAVPRAE